jgi:hypothetical protein
VRTAWNKRKLPLPPAVVEKTSLLLTRLIYSGVREIIYRETLGEALNAFKEDI